VQSNLLGKTATKLEKDYTHCTISAGYPPQIIAVDLMVLLPKK